MRQVTKIMNYLDYGIWAREFIGLGEDLKEREILCLTALVFITRLI